jgi:hypothetical protein
MFYSSAFPFLLDCMNHTTGFWFSFGCAVWMVRRVQKFNIDVRLNPLQFVTVQTAWRCGRKAGVVLWLIFTTTSRVHCAWHPVVYRSGRRYKFVIRTVLDRVTLPSMDQFSIIDEHKRMCCAEIRNKYCFKYIAVFFIRQPNFTNLTHRQLIEKKKCIQLCIWSIHKTGCPERTTPFPSMGLMHNVGKCRFALAVMYYIL